MLLSRSAMDTRWTSRLIVATVMFLTAGRVLILPCFAPAVPVTARSHALPVAACEGMRAACRGSRSCMRAVGLFYATQTGNTEEVAEFVAAAAGLEAMAIENVELANLAG